MPFAAAGFAEDPPPPVAFSASESFFSAAAPVTAAKRAMKPPPPATALAAGMPFNVAPSSFGPLIGPMRLRNTQPWPTVQRFVVIQYTMRPAGKLMMKKTKTNGSPYMIIFWLRSAVDGVSRLDSSCEQMYMTMRTARTQPVAFAVRSGMKRNSSAPLAAPTTSPHTFAVSTADVAAHVALQQVEQADEERHLRDERQAGRERVDLVVRVELHDFLLLALLVALVLVLELLELGRHAHHRLHRLELLDRQRREERTHDDRQQDDRRSPADADGVVEEQQHRVQEIDDPLDRREKREHEGCRCGRDHEDGADERRGLNRRCASTGS